MSTDEVAYSRYRPGTFVGLLVFIGLAASGCTSGETAHQIARPVEGSESARLLDIVGDTPVEHLPVPAPDVVGALAGDASVQGGAAAYGIAIEVPPGRRGMQPRVSLRYDSRAGNGIAGVGWSLSAGSSIYRCPRTIAHDGETRSVDFSHRDRLCLDGQRLIRVRGSYGQEGSEYRCYRARYLMLERAGYLMVIKDVASSRQRHDRKRPLSHAGAG
jgi:hypothetical protein